MALAMARCCIAVKKYEEALKILKKNMGIMWLVKNKILELKYSEVMGEIYYFLGDFEKSRFYHERFANGIIEPVSAVCRKVGIKEAESILAAEKQFLMQVDHKTDQKLVYISSVLVPKETFFKKEQKYLKIVSASPAEVVPYEKFYQGSLAKSWFSEKEKIKVVSVLNYDMGSLLREMFLEEEYSRDTISPAASDDRGIMAFRGIKKERMRSFEGKRMPKIYSGEQPKSILAYRNPFLLDLDPKALGIKAMGNRYIKDVQKSHKRSRSDEKYQNGSRANGSFESLGAGEGGIQMLMKQKGINGKSANEIYQIAVMNSQVSKNQMSKPVPHRVFIGYQSKLRNPMNYPECKNLNLLTKHTGKLEAMFAFSILDFLANS